MAPKTNPFFQIADLQSQTIEVRATNSTSGVVIPADRISLIEVADKEITIDIPSKSCSAGHRIAIALAIKNSGNEMIFQTQMTGVVGEIVDETPERQLIQVRFQQFSTEEWEAFLNQLSAKQRNLNQILLNTRK